VQNRQLLAVLAVAAGIALYYFAGRDTGHSAPAKSAARVVSLGENMPAVADGGLGGRLGPFPEGKLRAGKSRWAFAIEHSGTGLTAADIRAAAPGELKSVAIEREGKAREGVLRFANIAAPEFEPPSQRELQYRGRGLDAGDHKRVAALKRASWIGMRVESGPRARDLLRATQQMAVGLARSRHGFVWDAVTRDFFTPDALERRRLHAGALDVRDHITIDVYRAGQLFRLVTMGMEKFGLPDLVVEQSTGGKGVGQVVNLAAQLLVEGAGLSADGKLNLDVDALRDPAIRKEMTGTLLDGATRKAEVTALVGRPDKGDPENDLLELWFGEPAQVKQDEVASRVWGSKDEAIRTSHDDAVEAESRREREKAIRDLKPRFQRGELDHLHLTVKLPFREGSVTEWMWVEVVRWQGSEVRGILHNQPEIVHVGPSGSQVAGSESDIFDYMLSLPDGGTEGNTTGALLRAQSQR